MSPDAKPAVQVNCGTQAPASPPANFDSLAASFGALSVAIAFGSMLVGLLAVAITIVWNRSTKAQAVFAAREAAEAATLAFMQREGLESVDKLTRDHLAAQMTSNGVFSTATGLASGTSTAVGISVPPA